MSTENQTIADDADTNGTTAPDEVATTDEPLGAPGLAALKSEREAKAAAEKRAAAAEARIKAFEDAQKTEAEKQAERLAEIERENAELKSAKTRAELAASTGIPAELIAGPASGSAEDVEAFAKALDAWGKTAKKGPSSPAIGRANSATASSDADALTILGFS